MGADQKLPSFKPGDLLKASDLQKLSEALSPLTNSARGDRMRSRQIAGMKFNTIDPPSPYTIPFFNDSGFTIPAYGVFRITSFRYGAFVAGLSNIYGSQYNHLINGPEEVEDQSFGLAADGTVPVYAAYNVSDGTPTYGDMYGPRDSSFILQKNTGGFRALCGLAEGYYADNGIDDSLYEIIQVRREPFLRFHGVTDAAIAVANSGTVSIYYGSVS